MNYITGSPEAKPRRLKMKEKYRKKRSWRVMMLILLLAPSGATPAPENIPVGQFAKLIE